MRLGGVLVVDYGAQYAQLIARRVREAHVYSEIVSCRTDVMDLLARKPAAVILSGGPSSVYEDGAPQVDARLLKAGVPVLGICYGFQAMVQSLGGRVERGGSGEFGATDATVDPSSRLFDGMDASQRVWMSHRDGVVSLPPGFRATASTAGAPIAAFESDDARLCGVQWHPEVLHTAQGQRMLESFLYRCAGIEPDWVPSSIIDETVRELAEQIGVSPVICGLSGGVDSAVAAALVQRAVGNQLTCIFVDHGLLRDGESEQVRHDFEKVTGARLEVVDASEEFLGALRGVADPEKKRQVIGHLFIEVFERTAREVADRQGFAGEIRYLVQGTLYPDVVESGGGEGAEVIKTHHNVGGLPEDLNFELVEPLRRLFKDEVRAIGLELGLPEELLWRHPFPGPGLAIRIVGEVTPERLEVVRRADAIVRAELAAAGIERSIWQCPVVLLADVRSVGVQGDRRTYGHPVVLRPVTSEDAMTADFARIDWEVVARISNRITAEVPEVNRVVLDVTSKPPGTIEWE